MPKKRRPLNREYSRKLKAIRSFVDFNYDLRKPLHSSQKNKINRYFDAINAIEARPNKVYRSKNKKRVKTVQDFGRNGFDNLPGIKVAFYESPAANPVKLRFDKTGLKAHGEFFDIRYVPFNISDLLRNPEKEIERALNDPGAKGADWFRVAVGDNGQHSIASPAKRASVKGFINKLMTNYSSTDRSKNVNKGGYFGHWLSGLLPMTAKNQTELKTFLKEEAKQKEKIRIQRKRQRGALRKRIARG